MFIECLFRSFLLQFFNYLHKYWKNTIHFSDLTQEPLFYIKIHWNLGIELKTVSGLTYTHRKLTRNSIISKIANFWKIIIEIDKRIDAILFKGDVCKWGKQPDFAILGGTSRKSMKVRHTMEIKNNYKQWSTKHYTEN